MDTIKKIIPLCFLFLLFIATGCDKKPKLNIPIQYVSSDGWLVLQSEVNILESTFTKDSIQFKYEIGGNEQLNVNWYKWHDDYNKYLYILKLDPQLLASSEFEMAIKYIKRKGGYSGFIKEVKTPIKTTRLYRSKEATKYGYRKLDVRVLPQNEYLQNIEVQEYFQKLENDLIHFNKIEYKTAEEYLDKNGKEFITISLLGLLRYSDDDLNRIAKFLDHEIKRELIWKKKGDFKEGTESKVNFLLDVLQISKNPIAIDILSNFLDKLETYPYEDENGVDGRSFILSYEKAIRSTSAEDRDENVINVNVYAHELIRRSIISALGKMGDAALPTLLNLKPRSGFAEVDNNLYWQNPTNQPNYFIRMDGREIAWALSSIGDPIAYSYLIKLYNASGSEVKEWIIKALGEINNPKAIPFLSQLFLKDGPNKSRILDSLGETKDVKAIEYLLKFNKTLRPDDSTQWSVVKALLSVCDASEEALLSPHIFDIYDSDKSLFLELFEKMDCNRIDAFLDSESEIIKSKLENKQPW